MTSINPPLRWGILSTGNIARVFATGVGRSRLSQLVAVASRTLDSAKRFATEHNITRAFGDYDALLADPEVQAVYIGAPHPEHARWVIKAAEAGKHVLCEKPLGLNHAEAMVMAAVAAKNQVVLMEGYMYRCHPQTRKIIDLVTSGTIGTVGLIQASFSFNSEFTPASRLWSNDLAGGGILDVGGYPVSFARMLAGAVNGKPFLDPIEVTGSGHLHPETGIDVYAAATLKFSNEIVAQVSTGVGLTQDNSARIYGSVGWIEVPVPWIPTREGGTSRILVHRGEETEEIVIDEQQHLYGLEADAFADAVFAGKTEVPEIPIADTLGNLNTMDQWRAAIGLTYESEKPEQMAHTVARRPIRRSQNPPMRYGQVNGIDKPVSRLVLGVDNQRTMPHAAAMFDDYIEKGGNTFDTAWIYAQGLQEKLFGHWHTHRNIRNEIVLIGKGAHTPFCTPEGLTRQLFESLDRLKTDHLDLYLMHRDNPEIPVGEFVDVLNEHKKAGRINVFGGSNWSIDRINAANRYAKRKQLIGFSVLSNNFSLARMVDPVWAGCISASDPQTRKWLKKTQIPLFAWSSQARGFFTDRAGRDKLDDTELVRCWYADDNFDRRERALLLAEKKNVSPIAIAGAYVLNQPFPTFALIGPRFINETTSSLDSLTIELTPKELAWLNLEREKV
jgi:predicted dehydrogenase/aryl-alcohol dehydrogenase-like predicted oxidoreductase